MLHEQAPRRLCRHDPSRPRARRSPRPSKGFATRRLRCRMRALVGAAARAATCRWSSRASTTCSRGNRARMTLHAPTPASCGDCDLVYVAPDVPTDDSGAQRPLPASTRLLELVAGQCARRRRPGGAEPGAAGLHARPAARRTPALLSGRDAGLRPRGRARHQARALHRRLRRSCRSRCRPHSTTSSTRSAARSCRCAYESAELAKISINCCLVASVTVANTLAELCERIGADWAEIAPALRLDRRIGAARLSGARPRHRRRQPRARPGDRAAHLAGVRHRCRLDSRLRRQQRAPPRLAAAHSA